MQVIIKKGTLFLCISKFGAFTFMEFPVISYFEMIGGEDFDDASFIY